MQFAQVQLVFNNQSVKKFSLVLCVRLTSLQHDVQNIMRFICCLVAGKSFMKA